MIDPKEVYADLYRILAQQSFDPALVYDFENLKGNALTVLTEFLASMGHEDIADVFREIIETPDAAQAA